MSEQLSKNVQELYLVRDAHRKLKSGEPLSNEEIAAAIKHLQRVIILFECINDPNFKLFLDEIWGELERFRGFRRARKEKD